ncbi:hypothetical protein Hanom_Chr16g01493431 [Helianthus anomalus]
MDFGSWLSSYSKIDVTGKISLSLCCEFKLMFKLKKKLVVLVTKRMRT